MFNASVLWLENAGGGILTGAADNGMAPPSSVPKGNTAQRGRRNRERERVRLRQRGSRSGEEQTISTLISIPLLPRNTNNAAPKEPEANRDKAASSLTLGLCSSVLNQWQEEYTLKKKRVSCGIKSQSEGVVGGWEERKEEREREEERGWSKGDKWREARDRRKEAQGETEEENSAEEGDGELEIKGE